MRGHLRREGLRGNGQADGKAPARAKPGGTQGGRQPPDELQELTSRHDPFPVLEGRAARRLAQRLEQGIRKERLAVRTGMSFTA